MSATRLLALACLAGSVLLLWAGSGQEYEDAYVFPNLLAWVMIALSVVMGLTGGRTDDADEPELRPVPWGRLWPAFAVFLLYMAIAQEIGFFAASFLAFTALGVIYSSRERVWPTTRRCATVSLGFLAALYGLFVLLLQVQLPRGFLF